ncbi:hypothetical protein SAMN02745866_03642 [Alteromonadaceae bacterium Bs31]|nr:hypothetical protein SAMN02745866_03642 [Alteromonadaceae bacterium Bs31]
MRIYKNKHVIIAMIVAPILAITAYVATDYSLKETPQPAKAGQSYKLAAQSNCRYASGACTLKNADVKIQLQAERETDNTVNIALVSSLPLQRALITMSHKDAENEPLLMQSKHTDAKQWNASLDIYDPSSSVMRLIVLVNGASYFVETPAVFVDLETGFSRENFSQ